MPDLCYTLDYGSHIGEYIRQKLKEEGRKFSWVADKLNTGSQNFADTWLSKSELTPSQLNQLEEVLGSGFFREFFEKNPKLKAYPAQDEHITTSVENPIRTAERFKSGSGYSVSIEIDPVNFNPSHLQHLSESLKKALDDFQNKIQNDKM